MSKRYTDEFKQNILELHQKGIKTARELSNEYGVGYSTIHKSILATTPHPITKMTPEQSNADLKRIKELEEEVEILKKALGLFARK